MILPVAHSSLTSTEKRAAREEYTKLQHGLCWHCKYVLSEDPPNRILALPVNWSLFPEHFLKYPVHLQHDHITDMTEGAVHAYCNAVLWQYHGK